MKHDEQYEKLKINNTKDLKHPTIYYFLKSNQFSEHFLKNLRNSENGIYLNGIFTPINSKIIDGDILEILKNPSSKSNFPPCDGDLNIIFEDDDYLIVNKPHNLACVPTRSHINNNLGGQVIKYMTTKDQHFTLRIVNRLDKDTAGIVIIAKNVIAYNNIKNIEKTYFALCEGIIPQKTTISSPILTQTINGINQMKRIISPLGKKSITHIQPIKTFLNHSLIKLTLETGRTHQIRVHLSIISHPLLGDNIYNETTTLPHTFLILKEITFTHFRTNNSINLQINFPKEWEDYIK